MKKIQIPVTFVDASLEPMRFDALARLWYKNWEPYVEASTHCGYTYTLEKLIDAFGNFEPSEIRPYHIEQYQQAAYAAQLSVSYQRKLRGMMYQIMQMAVSGGLCSTNPVRGAQSLRRLRWIDEHLKKVERDSFSSKEIKGNTAQEKGSQRSQI